MGQEEIEIDDECCCTNDQAGAFYFVGRSGQRGVGWNR